MSYVEGYLVGCIYLRRAEQSRLGEGMKGKKSKKAVIGSGKLTRNQKGRTTVNRGWV